jgi:hypothetical protein
MKLHVGIAGVVWLAATSWGIAETKPTAPKGDPRAAALMEAASKTRYTWSQDNTAVSGKIEWDKDGKSGAATFRDVFHQRGGLTFSPEGGGEVPEEVREHVGSMIAHRVPSSPTAAKRPTPASMIVVEDEERGPLIMTVGDPMQSTQRVKDGRMVQVNRVMGGERFTIDVTEFEKSPDSHWYPSAFTVTWWEAPTGKKVKKQAYSTHGFQVIDGQMFPKEEQVVSEQEGKTSTLKIRYSSVKFETGRQRAANK